MDNDRYSKFEHNDDNNDLQLRMPERPASLTRSQSFKLQEEYVTSANHIKENLREQYAELKQTCGFGPNNPEPYLEIGDICFFSGATDEAKNWYRKAILVSNRKQEVLDHIARHIQMTELAPPPRPFYFDWDNVLQYPIRDGGWVHLIVAAGCFCLAVFSSYSLPSFIAVLLVLCTLLFAFLLRIIQDTYGGGNKLPFLFSEGFDFFSDVMIPGFKVFLLIFIYMLPFGLLLKWMINSGATQEQFTIAANVAIFLYSFLLPMAIGTLALSTFFRALNVILVVRITMRVLASYIIAYISLLLINYGFGFFVNSIAGATRRPSVILAILVLLVIGFSYMYMLYVISHIIGRVFHDNAAKLEVA